MDKYFKDPLNKEETAYDYFEVSPASDPTELKQAKKKSLENHPEDSKEIGEMWKICNTLNKRLKMDFFYYINKWRTNHEQ